jgi:hypothetical protein
VVIDTKKEKPPTQPGMPEPPPTETQPGSRLVVLGSALMFSDAIQDQMRALAGTANMIFASRAVTWLTGATPVSVPEKKPYTFTVSYGRAAQVLIPILLILVIPLGTVIIGIGIWWTRR